MAINYIICECFEDERATIAYGRLEISVLMLNDHFCILIL